MPAASARRTRPVYKVGIANPAPVELWGAHVGSRPAMPSARLPSGVFVADGFNAASGPVLTREASLVDELDALLAHTTAVNVGDDHGLLQFVNRWGLLGLAEPDTGTTQVWDSVDMTRAALVEIQHLTQWLSAMKMDDWSSAAIPASAALKTRIGLPSTSRKYTRPMLARRAFAKRLNEHMARVMVGVGLRMNEGELEPILTPRRLSDLLYVALVHHAGVADTVARRCDGCHGVFFVSTTTGDARTAAPDVRTPPKCGGGASDTRDDPEALGRPRSSPREDGRDRGCRGAGRGIGVSGIGLLTLHRAGPRGHRRHPTAQFRIGQLALRMVTQVPHPSTRAAPGQLPFDQIFAMARQPEMMHMDLARRAAHHVRRGPGPARRTVGSVAIGERVGRVTPQLMPNGQIRVSSVEPVQHVEQEIVERYRGARRLMGRPQGLVPVGHHEQRQR